MFDFLKLQIIQKENFEINSSFLLTFLEMKNIRPASILFLFIFFLVSFVVSTAVVGLLGVTKDQGLAAAAIGLGYGVMGAIGLTILAGILVMKLQTKTVIRLNKIGGLLILVFAIYVIIRLVFFTKDQAPIPQRTPTQPAPTAISWVSFAEDEMGLGFFKPNIYELQTMHLYGNLTPGKSLYESAPWDSVTFVQNELDQYAISYAPPILNAAHMKMDYEILLFRIVRLGKEFAEIKLSEQTGQTALVDLQAGKVVFWPEF